jgi:hypothetical protein
VNPSPAGQQVTITGCVQREVDYRRAQDAGKGGAAGTGAGVANEFVLVDASMSPAGAKASSSSPSAGATGTSGTATGTTGAAAAGGNTYELTGKGEGQAGQFVGKRVEISGMLKAATAGGPTAAAPPQGVDLVSKDLKLRELEVTSVREATGGASCPAAK